MCTQHCLKRQTLVDVLGVDAVGMRVRNRVVPAEWCLVVPPGMDFRMVDDTYTRNDIVGSPQGRKTTATN